MVSDGKGERVDASGEEGVRGRYVQKEKGLGR